MTRRRLFSDQDPDTGDAGGEDNNMGLLSGAFGGEGAHHGCHGEACGSVGRRFAEQGRPYGAMGSDRGVEGESHGHEAAENGDAGRAHGVEGVMYGGLGAPEGGDRSFVWRHLHGSQYRNCPPGPTDAIETAKLTAVTAPTATELRSVSIGRSLSVTMRAWWESNGWGLWPQTMDLTDPEQKEQLLQQLQKEELDEQRAVDLVRQWDKRVGGLDDIATCQVCGVEDFMTVSRWPLASGSPLALTGGEEEWLGRIGTHLHQYLSILKTEHGVFGIRGHAREGHVTVCAKCERGLKSTPPVRPPRSIAQGKHFGERGDLPQLTALEERLIAPVRTCITVVKLVPLGGCQGVSWGIKGHTISFPHDGVDQAVTALPNVGRLVETKVLFVGPREAWQAVQRSPTCRAKIERIFTVRWNLLLHWHWH